MESNDDQVDQDFGRYKFKEKKAEENSFGSF